MLSTAFYIVPLAPGGIFLGTLLLLLIVPVFAVAALALALLLGIAFLLALAAAVMAEVPVVLKRVARRQPRPTPSLDAVRRARQLLRRVPTRPEPSPSREQAALNRARPLG